MLICVITMNLAEQRYVFEWGREGVTFIFARVYDASVFGNTTQELWRLVPDWLAGHLFAYCIERWATIILRWQAVTALNGSFHVRGPLTAAALRPVTQGPHGWYGTDCGATERHSSRHAHAFRWIKSCVGPEVNTCPGQASVSDFCCGARRFYNYVMYSTLMIENIYYIRSGALTKKLLLRD